MLLKRVCVANEKESSGSRKRSGKMNKIYKVVWSKVKHCYGYTIRRKWSIV